MSLLLNMLSRLVITFLPSIKCLLISWLQSPSAVILEPRKIKVWQCFYCFPIYLPWSDGTGCHDDQFSSVSQSCSTLGHSMNCSMPGLPVHHQLSAFTQTHVQFPMSHLFTSGGQRTGVSALSSFLPKNTQGWSPLEWTGWISSQFKGLSRVSSSTTGRVTT